MADLRRRILVSGPLLVGARYYADTIGQYLNVNVPKLDFDPATDQNLTPEVLAALGERAFVVEMHMMPHNKNLLACRDTSISVTVAWRNLADTVIAFDQHAERFGARNPMFYVDHGAFVAMSQQRRYRYIIDSLVRWNISFYLSWRLLPGVVLQPHELMIRDRFSFFRTHLFLLGIDRDDERLAQTLRRPTLYSRMNADIVGHAATLLDEENRRHLERVILDHPEAAQLEVLVWELPWEPLELARVSPFDGNVVEAPDGTTYFVSSGKRREVDPSWLLSRGPERLRTPIQIGESELAELELEARLR